MDNFDNHLAGRNRLDNFFTQSLLSDLSNKAFGNRKGDIGFQQSNPNFAHCFVNVFFIQYTPGGDFGKD